MKILKKKKHEKWNCGCLGKVVIENVLTCSLIQVNGHIVNIQIFESFIVIFINRYLQFHHQICTSCSFCGVVFNCVINYKVFF